MQHNHFAITETLPAFPDPGALCLPDRGVEVEEVWREVREGGGVGWFGGRGVEGLRGEEFGRGIGGVGEFKKEEARLRCNYYDADNTSYTRIKQ